jgi:hypothetical protein
VEYLAIGPCLSSVTAGKDSFTVRLDVVDGFGVVLAATEMRFILVETG